MSYFQTTLRFAKLVADYIADEKSFSDFEFSDIITKRKTKNLTVEGYPYLNFTAEWDLPEDCMESLGNYLMKPFLLRHEEWVATRSCNVEKEKIVTYLRTLIPVLKNKQIKNCNDGTSCELQFTLSIFVVS